MRLTWLLGEAEAWVGRRCARAGLTRKGGQEGASLAFRRRNTDGAGDPVPKHALVFPVAHQSQRRIELQTYLCLEKSWGRSRGPSGTLALPLSAALVAGGAGRAAERAFDALVLRSRLPLSPVFWNLRTRSSVVGTVSSALLHAVSRPQGRGGAYLKSRSTPHPRCWSQIRPAPARSSNPWLEYLSESAWT